MYSVSSFQINTKQNSKVPPAMIYVGNHTLMVLSVKMEKNFWKQIQQDSHQLKISNHVPLWLRNHKQTPSSNKFTDF